MVRSTNMWVMKSSSAGRKTADSPTTDAFSAFLMPNNSYRIKAHILKRAYDVFPQFKAGLHVGAVMAGEIGVIKREIAYSGDVLNTASRIQSMCNAYQVNIIASADLIKSLNHPAPIKPNSLGTAELRGKSVKMELFQLVK